MGLMMQLSPDSLTFAAVGFAIGAMVLWFFMKGKLTLAETTARAAGEIDRTSLMEKLEAKSREIEDFKARLQKADEEAKSKQSNLDTANQERNRLAGRVERLDAVEIELKALLDEKSKQIKKVADLEKDLEATRAQAKKDLELIEHARKQLSDQFEVLANKILEEKSTKFTNLNQVNLNQILNPLQEKLKTFQAKVEEVYNKENKDRSELAGQVKILVDLNSTLSQDTQNLTLALKGDRKAQGNWGEIILDDVLEKAGLIRGQHYERQGGIKTDDGKTHVIPDVVINLPGDRYMVVDSKMTLPDYRAFSSADTEDDRNAALKRHLTSIRTHIKGLSEKNYQTLYDLKSLDFVVMFVPLEPAFMLAVTNDQELFQNAWERNVLLVSPSTLLFVVRTVAYLWRQEDLSRNAKEISNRGAELYDKLVGFVADLQKVGERIQQAQDSYNDARKKFSDGGGNVIRQAEMLKKLGVKPTKSLPTQWVEAAVDESPKAAI